MEREIKEVGHRERDIHEEWNTWSGEHTEPNTHGVGYTGSETYTKWDTQSGTRTEWNTHGVGHV